MSIPPSSLKSLSSLHEHAMGFSTNCVNVQHAERKHEMQAFVVRTYNFRLSVLSTEQFGIDDA
jgi:hypothetical protein